MARENSSRKWQITINNPLEHDFSHDIIKTVLNAFPSALYWCLCDEIGEQGTPHTHIYVVFKNAVMFSTMQRRFRGAHLEQANGTSSENRAYIRKEGKWQDDKKHETSLPETFEEWGAMPAERSGTGSDTEAIYDMVKQGYSDFDILEAYPSAMSRLDKISRARQTLIEEQYKNTFRNIETTYIWGDTGSGKTRSVMERYGGYEYVYRVTNYEHPFDGYRGQDVVVFEEFRSSLPIQDMLTYMEGYPILLPCRYADKVACFTKIFIITNIPLDSQYPCVQFNERETWAAFVRRIQYREHKTVEQLPTTDAIVELL